MANPLSSNKKKKKKLYEAYIVSHLSPLPPPFLPSIVHAKCVQNTVANGRLPAVAIQQSAKGYVPLHRGPYTSDASVGLERTHTCTFPCDRQLERTHTFTFP